MDYSAIKKSLKEIKGDAVHHPLKTGGILLASFLFLICTVAVSTYVSTWVSTKVTEKASNQTTDFNPPLDVYYKKISENKDENGVYMTVFRLFLHVPPYHRPKSPMSEFSFIWNGTKEIECSDQKKEGHSTETAGAYSSTTITFTMSCKTNTPIMDNGKLFSVSEI